MRKITDEFEYETINHRRVQNKIDVYEPCIGEWISLIITIGIVVAFLYLIYLIVTSR